jgi:multidrug efflux pump subunit AcrA (membrane-fusion protein)
MAVTKRQLLEATRRQGDQIRALTGEVEVANAQLRAVRSALDTAIGLYAKATSELAREKADTEIEEQSALNARLLLHTYREMAHQARQLAADSWMAGAHIDPTHVRDLVMNFERSISLDVTERQNCDDEGHPSPEWRKRVEDRAQEYVARAYPDIVQPVIDPEYLAGVRNGAQLRDDLDGFVKNMNGWMAGFTRTVKAEPNGAFTHTFRPRDVDTLIEDEECDDGPRVHVHAYEDYGGSDEPDDCPF